MSTRIKELEEEVCFYNVKLFGLIKNQALHDSIYNIVCSGPILKYYFP